jgi:hypothetical protein
MTPPQAHVSTDPVEPDEPDESVQPDESDRPDVATAAPARTDPVPEAEPVPVPARVHPNNEIVLQARAPKADAADVVEPAPPPVHSGGGRHAKPDDDVHAPSLHASIRQLTLALYRKFKEPLEQAWNSPPPRVSDALERIIAAEGPVVGDRIYVAYATASDDALSRALIGAVDVALARRIHQGAIVCDDPLNQGRVWRTYREPTQKAVLRMLGPRTLQQMPPEEQALLLAAVGATPDSTKPELYAEAAGASGNTRHRRECGHPGACVAAGDGQAVTRIEHLILNRRARQREATAVLGAWEE